MVLVRQYHTRLHYTVVQRMSLLLPRGNNMNHQYVDVSDFVAEFDRREALQSGIDTDDGELSLDADDDTGSDD
jgi:hypothetical protein